MNNPANRAQHPAFETLDTQTIDSLNLRVEHYRHRETGAVHYHLNADNSENVFLVSLRTVPQDSSGVAHILEHTALCGSQRYPVRDPFFMMLRRSLNTFMNAFTSSDWTAYPFASQNRKDFSNLLDVYLDAVFFSRLDPLDFAQEGHRVEFEESDNPSSDLVFKGVVFNEMKGAMSSVSSALWSDLCHHLFPTSTYHYNSGGDPENIPDLSYDDLVAFYRSHYHPSNATFMTFGDISAQEHQQVFEEKVLQHFERLPQKIEVTPEQRLSAPLRVESQYAYDENDDLTSKTHIVIAWMLGESSDLQQLLEAQLLASILMDNSASPLQQLLETTELGRAPSPLCGLEDSMREMVFCCGIEGSEAEHADALEAAVLEVIDDVASEGVSRDRLEAVLHQLELHQREISGDSYPYGLQLILQALGSATHYSDPIAVLNLEPVIAELREKIQDPNYIKDLARTLLQENTHRVTMVVSPSQTLSGEREQRESARLAAMKAELDEGSRAAIVKLAQDLQTRQESEDDPGLLPKVELSDVPASLPELTSTTQSLNGVNVTHYGRGTNGLVYQQVVSEIPQLDNQQLQMLPLYANVLTELGLGNDTYLQTQERQAAEVGSINAFSTLRGAIDDEQTISGHFAVSSKALARNAKEQSQLVYDTMTTVRFAEGERIRDLIKQQLARREQSITGNGHGLAMMAACAGMSPLAQLSHQQSGLEGIRALRSLEQSLGDERGTEVLCKELQSLHEHLATTEKKLLVIGEDQKLQELAEIATAPWASSAAGTSESKLSLPSLREARKELWLANTQVNFCAKAYPTVPVGHDDTPALTVLGGILRNGFLHRAIREQGGAYGGGASQDSGLAAFRFFSYRDPRLEETLTDFDASITWVIETQHEARVLEEAILGVVSSIDKPSSPAGEAKQHFHNRLYGRTHEQREAFRQQILAVQIQDIQRVAETYLRAEQASTAIIAPAGQLEATAGLREKLGLTLQTL